MPLPTLSIRVAPEHHRLVRDLAAALRTRPELADVLRSVLQTQHETVNRMTERDTDVLQRLQDHVDEHEHRLAALEAAAPLPRNDTATPRPAPKPAEPQPARSAKERPALRVPDDVQQRIRDMHARGMTRAAIAQELGISTGAVSKYKNPKPAD